MKKTISIVAILGLSACMGGGGGGVSLEPDPSVTSDINTLMQGARTTNGAISYNATVGRLTQDHAQDMVDRNYLSIFDQGTTGCAGFNGQCDIGDDLNGRNLFWDEIVQMVAEGDKTVPVVFAEFEGRTNGNNVGRGDLAEKLEDALTDPLFSQYEFFGLGKAGSGADTKWSFVFVAPRPDWSDR